MRLEQRDASQVASSFSSQRAALAVGCNVDAEGDGLRGQPWPHISCSTQVIPESLWGVASLLGGWWVSVPWQGPPALLWEAAVTELVGTRRLLEKPALLHPTSMPSLSCRLRFGRGDQRY